MVGGPLGVKNTCGTGLMPSRWTRCAPRCRSVLADRGLARGFSALRRGRPLREHRPSPTMPARAISLLAQPLQ